MANISNELRLGGVLGGISMMYADAAMAAKKGEWEKMERKIVAALEMLDPLVRSMEMLENSQGIRRFLNMNQN